LRETGDPEIEAGMLAMEPREADNVLGPGRELRGIQQMDRRDKLFPTLRKPLENSSISLEMPSLQEAPEASDEAISSAASS
jgi:hypothetical protein